MSVLPSAAHDATKSYKYLEQMESTIKGIFSFYHYSPRRKNEVKAIAEILDVDFAHMNLAGFCFNAFSFMTAASTKSDISINNRSSS
jgi:hypothetical protein